MSSQDSPIHPHSPTLSTALPNAFCHDAQGYSVDESRHRENHFTDVRESGSDPPELAAFFYYFAYGSCMCPVDLKRSLGEPTHLYVLGPALLQGYRLGFFRKSRLRNCGVLDIVKDPTASVQGVLYRLPWRLSAALDEREEGYCHEMISVVCRGRSFAAVRTYTVIDKMVQEYAPNDWYFNIVMRGAVTCGLPEHYCWQLFNHMHQLQEQHGSLMGKRGVG